MNIQGRTAIAVATVALATLGLGGGVAAAVSTAPASASGVENSTSLAPTSIKASQATYDITQMQLENMHASVTDARTEQPLAGMKVLFYTTSGRLLGSAYTNYEGIAAIDAPEDFGPGTVEELTSGYDAVLQGDGVHAPARAHGAITVGTGQQASTN
jgi:hypothetical protein